MPKSKKFLCFTVITLLVLGPVVALSLGTTEGQPVVGSYDEPYEKTVDRGEETTFRWTIEKVPDDPDYTVSIRTEGLEGLNYQLDPESIFILKNDKIVTLTVEVPTFPDVEKIEASVNFSFSREGKIQHQAERDITINIGDLPDAAEANTIVGGYRNPLPSPLNGPIGAFMLNLLIWFVIGMTVFFIVTPFLHKLTKKTQTDLDRLMLKMIRRPLLVFIFLYGFINSLLRLELPFEIRASLFQVYSLLALGIGVYVAYQIFDGILDEISLRRGGETSPFGKVLKPIFEKAGMIIILLGGLIIGMRILGVQITALLAGAGVLGLVVAFAAQDTLSNFFSGVHLLLDRPFTIGDVLELESGEYCRVENVGMRSTKLYNIRDHEMIILPNNAIANQKIKNLAEPDKKKRVVVNVGVAYGSDIDRVKSILYDVLKDEDSIIEEEGFEPVVRFSGFGDSSLNFNLRFWIDNYMKQWDIASVIRNKIDQEFREAEVTIPFPQRTVWMKSEIDL
ncbi:MAG: mechanosensitive ion channel family protein [Candidatus Thermoplasmatota archaeon]|nr:mechanosensitive ion channel family protein [Candidatus Thermoplasmatota archaeon]